MHWKELALNQENIGLNTESPIFSWQEKIIWGKKIFAWFNAKSFSVWPYHYSTYSNYIHINIYYK